LIETGTNLEWKIFLNQLDNGEVDTLSVSEWLKCTFNRLGPDAKFIQVFRTGNNNYANIFYYSHPPKLMYNN
jgi:hypothetical protein